jgi:phenylacetate-CoA ligase
MVGYQDLRQRHVAALMAMMPDIVQRLGWSRDRIRREREDRLRDLLRLAKARSPWHRERLRDIDPERAREEDLQSIPPMTKQDLMEHWNDIVPDDRLPLHVMEAHLAGLITDRYLLDEFHAVASGGSTGRRGVFVFGWDSWAIAHAGFMRRALWDRTVDPELAALPNTVAMVAAHNATHMTSAIGQTFSNPMVNIQHFPVIQPLDVIVAGLNEFRPTTVIAYASILGLLAAAAREGRLRIAPRRVISTSEPLLPEIREAVEETFGAPLANIWGTSEAGPMATGCWRGPGTHLCDDLVIIEPVDQDGRSVPVGTTSDKVYVTAISNPTLPLIRFELTDRITVLDTPCPCGSAHRLIADIEGRLDDAFAYGDAVLIHPHVFRSVLAREASVVEYQVRQTARGADVEALGTFRDPVVTGQRLESALARLGVPSPCVTVRVVPALQRQATGKIRRFVPLA